MTTETAKIPRYKPLYVQTGTKAMVLALQSAYMKKHGRTITEEGVIHALLERATVKDLPAPEVMGERVRT